MSSAAKYEISSSGELLEGFEAPPVIEAFSTLFSVSPEKAATFVGKQRVVRKNLTLEEATVYRKNLTSIGIDVSVRDMSTSETVNAANDAVNKISTEKFALVPSDDTNGSNSSTAAEQTITCPKCELTQDKTQQCTGCGVYFSKVNSASSDTEKTTHSSTDSATRKNPKTSAPVTESDDFHPGQLIGAVIAAIVGALAWHLIAVNTGYEFGFVAWGIGGAVGMAAAMSGASGNVSGIACAILVVLAILGGKLMFYSSFEDDLLNDIQAMTTDADLQPIYDEMKYDAESLADIPSDDASLRTYMVNHAFTDVESANSITEQELEDFKVYFLPELETFQQTQPTFEDWKLDYQAQIFEDAGDISTPKMVLDSLGVLDLVFLLLGISTAYKIGRVGKS